jgi:hypothetical protein
LETFDLTFGSCTFFRSIILLAILSVHFLSRAILPANILL